MQAPCPAGHPMRFRVDGLPQAPDRPPEIELAGLRLRHHATPRASTGNAPPVWLRAPLRREAVHQKCPVIVSESESLILSARPLGNREESAFRLFRNVDTRRCLPNPRRFPSRGFLPWYRAALEIQTQLLFGRSRLHLCDGFHGRSTSLLSRHTHSLSPFMPHATRDPAPFQTSPLAEAGEGRRPRPQSPPSAPPRPFFLASSRGMCMAWDDGRVIWSRQAGADRPPSMWDRLRAAPRRDRRHPKWRVAA
jgi:hypothetical protein